MAKLRQLPPVYEKFYKYSQWHNFRKMEKSVRLGTYKPPGWYYAMRAAPPPHQTYVDPTYRVAPQFAKEAVRKSLMQEFPELSKFSKGVVHNFWMEKPVESLVRQYQSLLRQGVAETEARRTVGEEFTRVSNVVNRQRAIVAHQAKVDGQCISLREARGILHAVNWVNQQKGKVTDDQYDAIEDGINKKVLNDMKTEKSRLALWKLADDTQTKQRS